MWCYLWTVSKCLPASGTEQNLPRLVLLLIVNCISCYWAVSPLTAKTLSLCSGRRGAENNLLFSKVELCSIINVLYSLLKKTSAYLLLLMKCDNFITLVLQLWKISWWNEEPGAIVQLALSVGKCLTSRSPLVDYWSSSKCQKKNRLLVLLCLLDWIQSTLALGCPCKEAVYQNCFGCVCALMVLYELRNALLAKLCCRTILPLRFMVFLTDLHKKCRLKEWAAKWGGSAD